MFDYNAFSERLMNDQTLMQAVFETFTKDLDLQVKELKESSLADDIKQVSALAHKIKGAAANVGAMVLSALMFEIEQSCKANDKTILLHQLDNLEPVCTNLIKEMADKLS